jgi:hypothetical protein
MARAIRIVTLYYLSLPGKLMNKKKVNNIIIKDIIYVLAALATISTFTLSLTGPDIFRKLFAFISQRPGWFWYRESVIYLSFVIVSFACAWLWNPQLFPYFLNNCKINRLQFFLKAIFSAIIIIPFAFLLTFYMFEDRLPSFEAEKIFPQAAALGPTFIRTYATNGVVHQSFLDQAASFGPRDGCARITFKLFGSTLEQNGGWVLYLFRGVDLRQYRELRFLVRGEDGKEKIGIKAKDASGIEVQLSLEGSYLRSGEITSNWQEAIVPLSHFGNVDFSFMENFSIFTTGVMAGTRPQTIYVGEFNLM